MVSNSKAGFSEEYHLFRHSEFPLCSSNTNAGAKNLKCIEYVFRKG
jgi:hypothetical protein